MTRIYPPKDASGAYVKETIKPDKLDVADIPSPLRSDLELSSMLDGSLQILFRELYFLRLSSASGKLTKDDAIALRDYIKLLKDLKERERKLLDDLTDEELVEAKRKLDERA